MLSIISERYPLFFFQYTIQRVILNYKLLTNQMNQGKDKHPTFCPISPSTSYPWNKQILLLIHKHVSFVPSCSCVLKVMACTVTLELHRWWLGSNESSAVCWSVFDYLPWAAAHCSPVLSLASHLHNIWARVSAFASSTDQPLQISLPIDTVHTELYITNAGLYFVSHVKTLLPLGILMSLKIIQILYLYFFLPVNI